MPKFIVTLEEVASYEVEVEAATEEEAAERAEARFVDEGCAKFPCEVHQREVGNVEQVES